MKQTLTQEDINRSLIQSLTGLTPFQYELMIIECANQWIETNISTDIDGVASLVTSPAFWLWWNRQWDARNKTLIWNAGWMHLNQKVSDEFMSTAHQLHSKTHDIHLLNVWPASAVLAATFKNIKI